MEPVIRKSAQLQALHDIVCLTRQIVPPTLDFVVLLFAPDGTEIRLTSAMFPSLNGKTELEQYNRAKVAAQAFIDQKPDLDFAARAERKN